MTTSRYIVSNTHATSGSFLDLGIQGRGLSDTTREIIYHGGTTTTERVYLREGITLDFATRVGTGNRTVYLDGNYAGYTFNTATAGQLTLTRTGESLTVLINATTTLVFADGSATTDAAGLATNGATLAAARSTLLTAADIAGMSQNLRVITYDGTGEAHAIARAGTVYTASGGTGVDSLYVEAGAKVTALDLGAGADRIYLTRNFADYARSVSGLVVTLSHAGSGESVSFSASEGANNNQLVFADGMMGTVNLRVALKAASADMSAVTTAGVTGFDTTVKTAIYTPGAVTALALASDTAAGSTTNTDGITRDGTLNFARAAGDVGDRWEYSTNGTTWNAVNVAADGLGFDLAGQGAGGTGVTYAAGSVQVRQVSAAGVVGTAVANAAAIVVDTAASDPGLATQTVAVELNGFEGGSTNATGRYVLISKTAANYLRVHEVQILDGSSVNLLSGVTLAYGTNVRSASGGVVDTIHTTFPLANINDGGTGTSFDMANTASSATNWLLLDLGADKAISTVSVQTTGVNATEASNFIVYVLSAAAMSGFGITGANMVGFSHAGVTTALANGSLKGLDGSSYFSWGSVTAASTQAMNSSSAIHQENAVSTEHAFTGIGAESGATITVTATNTSNSTVISNTAVVSPDGTWSVTLSGLVDAANYNVTSAQTDRAGNQLQAAQSLVVRVDKSIPGFPDMVQTSDSGVNTADNVTNNATPSFAGNISSTTAAGTAVSIYLDGSASAAATVNFSTSAAQSANGLTVNADGTWTYTQPSTLLAGGHNIKMQVGTKTSAQLDFVIDTTAVAPTVTSSVPTMIVSSTFDASGNLTLTGTAEAGSTAVNVAWSDGDALTTTDPSKAATVTQNVDGTTTWSVTFTAAELTAMNDGAVTYTVTATDRAGNLGTATSASITLELDNTAPAATATAIPTVNLSIGTTGVLLNLTDINGDSTANDPAFTDADAAGSAHAALTYSGQVITALGADTVVGGGDDTYGALPAWLEVTSAGLVQVVSGQTPVVGSYNLHLTATDGATTGLTATRDIALTVSAGVTLTNAAMQGGVDLDLRTDLMLTASEAVTLVAATGATGMTITLVNTTVTDGSRNMVLDLTNAADRGRISIVNGTGSNTIEIDMPYDLDAGAAYRLEVSAGAFTGSSGGSLALDATSGISFSAFDPTALAAGASGSADLWNAPDAITGVAGFGAVTWHNLAGHGSLGTDANGFASSKAAAIDVGTGSHVLYLGAITGAGSNLFTTGVDSWAQVNNLGANDRIYFDDQANNATTYGLYSVANSVSLTTYDEGAAGVDGNRASVSPAAVGTTSGLWLDITLDATDWNATTLGQNYANAWSGGTEPTFGTVYGQAPVMVA